MCIFMTGNQQCGCAEIKEVTILHIKTIYIYIVVVVYMIDGQSLVHAARRRSKQNCAVVFCLLAS